MKVLISAFACEPGRGSEPGIGWHWAEQASRFHEVWILTHPSHRHKIEEQLQNEPNPNIHIVYVNFPAWTSKSGLLGLVLRLQYIAWQAAAFKVAKRLHADVKFDIAHHVTYGSYRYPTSLAWLGVPFIWGPIGGGERAPIAFYRSYGWKGAMFEALRDLSNLFTRVDPVVHLNARRAERIIAVTPDTASCLPGSAQSKVIIAPAIGFDADLTPAVKQSSPRAESEIRLIYAGMLLHRKGVHLLLPAIRTVLDRGVDVRLNIVGNGPMAPELRALSNTLHLGNVVNFFGELPRAELIDFYREHDIFVFPSLQDSGGFVVLEAMAAGLPVICLDLGGPAQIVTHTTGIRVAALSPQQVNEDLAVAIMELNREEKHRLELASAAHTRVSADYQWSAKGELINDLYRSVSDKYR